MRWKRSKSRAISASGTPIPVSATVTTALSPTRLTETEMDPSNVYLRAFDNRLRTTFSHMSWSTQTGSSIAGQSTENRKPARSMADRKMLASSAV